VVACLATLVFPVCIAGGVGVVITEIACMTSAEWSYQATALRVQAEVWECCMNNPCPESL